MPYQPGLVLMRSGCRPGRRPPPPQEPACSSSGTYTETPSPLTSCLLWTRTCGRIQTGAPLRCGSTWAHLTCL